MLTIRLLGIGAVIAILLLAVGNSGQVVQAQQETFRTLTVGKLAGVRLDAANPPAGLPSSGLILGLGADLMVLAGNVTIKRPSTSTTSLRTSHSLRSPAADLVPARTAIG
jgi:hypothetical protein